MEQYPPISFFIKKGMIFFVIAQYIWLSKLHYKYKNIKNYSLFRYEDLLSDPERAIKKICEFTEIAFVPEMLEPQKDNQKGQISSLTGERKKSFDKKATTRSMTRISTFDKTVIILFTEGSIKRFGYD